MPVDLDETRMSVYEAAYNTFQMLEEEGYNQYRTYGAVNEAYDRDIAPFVRSCVDSEGQDPEAERIEVEVGKNTTSVNSTQFYQLMDTHIAFALRDVFDPGRKRFESVINELER
ncbi:hypothetical protein [Candidatus Nanohalococcus occultus]|uniref:hypothetical protein n=1 Tax=Candidatus Nanohalococcus occultus TaxID=2978047 RepID=UPI0039E1BC1F